MKSLINSREGCKAFYKSFNSNFKEKPLCETIWQDLLLSQYQETELTDKFKLMYKICFKIIDDNDLIWFQYRILYKILGTNDYLNKINLRPSSECNFCKDNVQNITHLFAECITVCPLWDNLRAWMLNKVGVNIMLNTVMKIVGYTELDQHFWPLNFVLIVTRKYIFWCSKKDFPLDIYFLQKEIKRKFIEQETLYKIKGHGNIFNKRWIVWRKLFDGIDLN